VLQDVVADAMTTEVVDRKRPDGSPRPLHEVERELGLVQVLGRLALWSGILSVAGLSGWLAQIVTYEAVFLLGLIVPAISVTGATLVRLDGASPRPIDWRILGGGLLFGAAVLAIGLGGLPFGQELIFLISVTIIGLMLARVAQDVDEQHRKKILFAAQVTVDVNRRSDHRVLASSRRWPCRGGLRSRRRLRSHGRLHRLIRAAFLAHLEHK